MFDAAKVKGADDDQVRRHFLSDPLVRLVLLFLGRKVKAVHVKELGAVKADALSPVFLDSRDLPIHLKIRHQDNAPPILGLGRRILQVLRRPLIRDDLVPLLAVKRGCLF